MQSASESFNVPALISSEALPWQGIRVEHIYLHSGALPAGYCADHVLVLHQAEEPLLVRRRNGGRVYETVYHTDDLSLCPSGDQDFQVELATPSNNIYLTLDYQYLAQLIGQDPEKHVALCERLKFTDPLLVQLGRQLLLTAGTQHALGLLYVESLTNTLCHQLIEHHATPQRYGGYPPRLSATVMARIDAYLEATGKSP